MKEKMEVNNQISLKDVMTNVIISILFHFNYKYNLT